MFIKGIKTMVIGLRDNNGIVNRISPLPISDIEQATVIVLILTQLIYFVLIAYMDSSIILQFLCTLRQFS